MIQQTKRYYPLIDEIRNHVFQWAADPDWKTIPPGVNVALTQVMNEIKIAQSLAAVEARDDRFEPSKRDEQSVFMNIFRQKYIELTDFEFNDTITPVNRLNLNRTLATLKQNGASIIEYLEWLFDDFCTLECNKEQMPPRLNWVCSSYVVNKFLYQKKDDLQLRKDEAGKAALKNALLGIALPLNERLNDKDFAQKIVDYNKTRISATKFLELIKAFAQRAGDREAAEQCAKLEAAGKNGGANGGRAAR